VIEEQNIQQRKTETPTNRDDQQPKRNKKELHTGKETSRYKQHSHHADRKSHRTPTPTKTKATQNHLNQKGSNSIHKGGMAP
jgi:hypothetical protein